MRKTLYKNSISGIIQLIISSLLTLITIPAFIKYLGIELYGLFSVISIIGNLNIFINLGLNTTLIKFVSEQGKNNESNLDIVITLILTSITLIPLTILILYFNRFILLNILNVPNNFFDIAKILYFCLVISNFFMFLGQTFGSVIDSQQRIIITNLLQLIYNFMYWGFMLLALITGHSLDVIGFGLLLSSIIWFILIVILFFKIWGRIEIVNFKTNFLKISRKQIKYGFQIYASGLVSFFYEPLTKILISNFLGIKEVGFFDIALKLRNQFQSVIGKIFYPLLPYLAKISDFNRLRLIVHDIEQKTFFLLPPFLTSVIFCSSPFINIWIGKDSELISFGVIFILCSFMVGSFTVIPFYQFLLTKRPYVTIVLQIVNVVVNALCFLLTYRYLGFYSIFLAYAIAILFSFTFSLFYQHKILDSLIFDSFTQLIKTVSFFIICFFGCYLSTFFIYDNLIKLLIIPITLVFISILSIRYLKLFKKEDMQRYIGENTGLYKFGLKIFIRN
jgi:O-antigen/teichoic acid export membrane protein